MSARRTFLKTSAAGAAALTFANGAPATAAPDALTVALIGCGGMGKSHLNLLARHKKG